MALRETLTNTWNHIQGFLFPMLREEVGPLTAHRRWQEPPHPRIRLLA
jgi:hypothetical protein